MPYCSVGAYKFAIFTSDIRLWSSLPTLKPDLKGLSFYMTSTTGLIADGVSITFYDLIESVSEGFPSYFYHIRLTAISAQRKYILRIYDCVNFCLKLTEINQFCLGEVIAAFSSKVYIRDTLPYG